MLVSLIIVLRRMSINDMLSVVRLVKELAAKVEEHVILGMSEQVAVCDNSKANAKNR